MAIQDDNTILNKGDLKAYHEAIAPMLGGTFMVSTNNSEYYSTDEKVVGVWTDGKPIYQKTFTYSSATVNSTPQFYIVANISPYNIDKIINCFGNMQWGVDGPYYSLPFTLSTDYVISVDAYLSSETPDLILRTYRTNGTTTISDITITLQYTKTTDTAGSATTTPGAYDINFPNTWPENTEIYFGNGLYGIRATGSHATTASRYDAQLLQWTNGVEIVSYGGHIYPDNTTWNIQIPYTWTENGSNYFAYIYGNNDPTHPSWNGIMLYLKSNINLTAKWDVWVTYKKS